MSTRKSTRKKLANAIAKLLKQVVKLSQAITKPLMRWLLRSLFILHRRSRVTTAGFVLPTAIMVTLVVTLLVTAIVLRSFDRVKNASNYRVNQAVFNAAAPAIERAQAKLEALFEDPTLPRSTPSEEALENAFNSSKYNFGDETRLLLKDEDSQGNESTINTAWRFPVDTDNNGLFDSYTLYGIYFKSPNPLLDEKERTPLQARTPPMGESNNNKGCEAAASTSASLVDNSGWFRSGSKLKKSIFVYTATVPIVAGDTLPDNNTYETYKGEAGFSALEYQQDRARIPLANNAIVYEDDLQITPGSGIQINGRVFTNGNFLTGNGNNQYFQVSSPESCYYTEENSKIVVGGNMAFGRVDQEEDQDGGEIHLFNGEGAPAVVELNNNDRSVNQPPNEIGNNSQAFTARINALVTDQLNNGEDTDPEEVKERYKKFTGDEREKQRNKALETYFKDRTRRVPYGEVGPEVDLTANPPKATPQGKGDELRPQDDWIFPYDPGTSNSNNGLTLNIRGNTLSPAATEPSKQQGEGKELKIGDRVLIGHGLPAQWWDDTAGAGDFQGARAPQEIDGDNVKWNDSEENRFRTTQVTPLSDLGDTDRNGFWEIAAARQPVQPLEGYGGLRVVTGAGIYVDDDESDLLPRTKGIPNFRRNNPTNPELESYLPPPAWDIRFVDPSNSGDDRIQLNDITTQLIGFPIVVWPDTMPMHGGVEGDLTGNNGDGPAGITDANQKSDLLMRASAVYHYTQNEGTEPESKNFDQEPIACVSSYYDPTDENSAKNNEPSGDGNWDTPDRFDLNNGRSNNGIVYTFPGRNASDQRLERQSRLVFPNGRLANEPLRTALLKPAGERTLADNSAIDTAICALEILGGAAPMGSPPIPHGAIYEQSFLNARQIQEIEDHNTPELYDLAIEDRQPLEIRATVLDLNLLRTTSSGTSPNGPSPEFLLPDSGIIYATRDDALLDLSDKTGANPEERRRLSSVDFELDPTRRPNGIILSNGTVLARQDESNSFDLTDPAGAEKGLILATNLPVYIQAAENNIGGNNGQSGFNLHQTPGGALVEEFTQQLGNNQWDDGGNGNFYGRNDLDGNFACRQDDDRLPNCNQGDLWRPAVVIADSVTLLSRDFNFGFRSDGDYDLRGIPMGSNLINPNQDNLTEPVNEITYGADLNRNGRNDPEVLESQIVIGYDVDGNGNLLTNFNETDLTINFDLNGDGLVDNPNVPESEITVAAGLKLNGIFDNNFVTSANWWDVNEDGNIDNPDDLRNNPQPSLESRPITAQNPNPRTVNSSYLSNFVTPIQRRVQFPEYVMEICRKVPVSACNPDDWVVGIDGNNNRTFDPGEDEQATDNRINTGIRTILGNNVAQLLSGTTATPAKNLADQRYPRRIAFLRNENNELVIEGNAPIPVGINDSGIVQPYPYDRFTRPRLQAHALWYRTARNPNNPTNTALSFGQNQPLFYQRPLVNPTTEQPMLVPVLQVHSLTAQPRGRENRFPIEKGECVEMEDGWTQRANQDGATFNVVIASGDSPPRPEEYNGSLENFVRFLENWRQAGGTCRNNQGIPVRISGSLIQFKRAAYDTAPFVHANQDAGAQSVPTRFGYDIDDRDRGAATSMPYATASGELPYYMAPTRRYGFDVALLTQLPDLFSSRFTTPSAGDPDEFFREVSRDDSWVETLLCAKEEDDGADAVNQRYCRK
ncbi:hormogonium polysaccharide biosynthesis protein HpsA [Moorena producens JHB]|uniref:Hormogonium polysaccharide biosynthesis protein HpsA n=1 Tax=Moorena producens (strain JHB) TaxID=1454205 RepID=A0A1D9G7Q7_MOOP1|nr:hormogonium polysaccharide biosynthesis protein HpsA [Moorena producens]AOY83677.1 hormogonium polysaccharide biosynthesis protein HpsA [Moorena producens JHB]